MGAEESTLGGDEGGDEVSILVNTVPGDARDGSTAHPPSSGETGGKEKGRKGPCQTTALMYIGIGCCTKRPL